MEVNHDTSTNDTFESYALYENNKLIATIHTYDAEGSQTITQLFSRVNPLLPSLCLP